MLGFTDFDGFGVAGVEKMLQPQLAGKPGRTVARFDKAGRVIPTSGQSHVDPIAGKDVELTLDRDLEWYAQRLIPDQIQATGARNGSAAVIDVTTGEDLALSSAPPFNTDNR